MRSEWELTGVRLEGNEYAVEAAEHSLWDRILLFCPADMTAIPIAERFSPTSNRWFPDRCALFTE